MRWDDYSRLSRWAQYNHNGHYKREAKVSKVEGDETIEAEARVMPLEDRGSSQEPKNAGGI